MLTLMIEVFCLSIVGALSRGVRGRSQHCHHCHHIDNSQCKYDNFRHLHRCYHNLLIMGIAIIIALVCALAFTRCTSNVIHPLSGR